MVDECFICTSKFYNRSKPTGFYDLKHFLVNKRVACAELVTEEKISAAGKISDPAPGLFNDNSASCDIPGMQIVFKKSFKLSTGHECQIHRGASQSPDTVCFVKKFLDDIQVVFTLVEVIIRKSRREKTLA